MLYVNLLLINLNTVPIYELKNKYPNRVALTTEYLKMLFPAYSWVGPVKVLNVGLHVGAIHLILQPYKGIASQDEYFLGRSQKS